MPFQIIRNDITLMQVDAIVNAANKSLLGGGGVDGAIHRAAGPELLEECRALGGCKTGEAKLTRGYSLPCRYVIHTVGPVWRGGWFGERQKLAACYWNALELAYRNNCRSVAFPLISAGAYGYPRDKAVKVAVETISAFLLRHDEEMQVYLVVFGKEAVQVSAKLFENISQYIDDNYVMEHIAARRENLRRFVDEDEWMEPDWLSSTNEFEPVGETLYGESYASAPMPMHGTLEDALGQLDESFSDMVLRLIKEKGMKNADCYKKANLDKKLFSKINNAPHYQPKKTTAVALAIALELNLADTKDLLMKAGYALSHSDKFDVIVEYFILHHQYDIFEINEVLFYYDQPLLGSVIA